MSGVHFQSSNISKHFSFVYSVIFTSSLLAFKHSKTSETLFNLNVKLMGIWLEGNIPYQMAESEAVDSIQVFVDSAEDEIKKPRHRWCSNSTVFNFCWI